MGGVSDLLKNTKEGLGSGRKETGSPLESNLGYCMEDLAHKQTTEPASSALYCGTARRDHYEPGSRPSSDKNLTAP